MNLKNYINSRMFADATGIDEAISSGRMRSKCATAMPESLQLKDIMSWLENIGVPMLSPPSKFKINYFFTNNGQNLVVLFPETKQHSEFGFIFKISPTGFTYPMRMEEEGEPPTHYNGGDRAQNEMFFYKIYSLATNGSINEAISSGKHGKYAPSEGCSVEDIVKWLENNGVKGKDWEYYKKTDRTFIADPGEIVYQIGPCDTPGHSWVAVCINVKESGHRTLQRVVLHTKDNTFYTQNGQEHKISFENGVRAVERMIDNPNELVPENVFLGIKDSSGINEAISSGKYRRGNDPKFGVSVEELVEWIRGLGVTKGRHFDASLIYPSPGGVMYEIGPCENGQTDTFWVQVIGTTRRDDHQIVTISTKNRKCDISIEGRVYKGETIDFDDAVDYARQIIEDPNTLIDI